MLAAWPANRHSLMGMFFVTGAYGGIAPLMSAWLNSYCGGNRELRVLASLAHVLSWLVSYLGLFRLSMLHLYISSAMGNVQLRMYLAG